MDRIECDFKRLKKIVSHCKRTGMTNSSKISFEFIVGSCFPNVLENIKTEMKNQYTQGYMQALKDNEVTEGHND